MIPLIVLGLILLLAVGLYTLRDNERIEKGKDAERVYRNYRAMKGKH